MKRSQNYVFLVGYTKFDQLAYHLRLYAIILLYNMTKSENIKNYYKKKHARNMSKKE